MLAFQPRCLRWIQWAALLAVCLWGLGACSAWRLAYRQGPSLSYWWLDRYVDFNGAQTALARSALDRWFTWQRQALMPEIRTVLLDAEQAAFGDPAPEQICAWWGHAQRWRDAAFERALPDLGALALSLTPAQWARIEARHAQTNETFEDDFLQPDLKRRADASFSRLQDHVEMLYGRLQAPQLAALRQGLDASPFDPQRWQVERLRRQSDLMQTLRGLQSVKEGGSAEVRATPQQAQDALRAWWERVKASPDPVTRQYQNDLVRYNCQMAARFHQVANAAQRQHAKERLQSWAADAASLMLGPLQPTMLPLGPMMPSSAYLEPT